MFYTVPVPKIVLTFLLSNTGTSILYAVPIKNMQENVPCFQSESSLKSEYGSGFKCSLTCLKFFCITTADRHERKFRQGKCKPMKPFAVAGAAKGLSFSDISPGLPEPPMFEISGSSSSSRQIPARAPTPTHSHRHSWAHLR